MMIVTDGMSERRLGIHQQPVTQLSLGQVQQFRHGHGLDLTFLDHLALHHSDTHPAATKSVQHQPV
jgi:hypothetical protein